MRTRNLYCRVIRMNDRHSAALTRLLAKMPAALLVILAGLPCGVAASHIDLFFAEPYTGEKVGNYSVTLPVTGAERVAFEIPADCDQAVAAFMSGAMRWGTQIEKRVWGKVAGDCEYYAFVHRYPFETGNDFVTGYDYKNAPLADLVFADECHEQAAGSADCESPQEGPSDVFGLLAIENAPPDAENFDAGACYIRDGRFRGRVMLENGQLRCLRDPRAPGFRIIAVNFSDANGDGYLDAVLRLIPLGPGMSRMPMVLAYTRKAPDERFSLATPEIQDTSGNQRDAR